MLILVISLFKETELLTSLQTARPVTLRVSNTHLDTSETWAPLSVAIAAATKPEGTDCVTTGAPGTAEPREPTRPSWVSRVCRCERHVYTNKTAHPRCHRPRAMPGPPAPGSPHAPPRLAEDSEHGQPSLSVPQSVSHVRPSSLCHPSITCLSTIHRLSYLSPINCLSCISICLSPFNALSLSLYLSSLYHLSASRPPYLIFAKFEKL